uniref:NADP-dependent oxidoreductase domain-containing protein n=1 Tax=Mycena chlorophos TaxID=658473 RepID=A0ABQ0KUK8_MYCCL|nr:predicted protein [Mycena chlorophos]
MLTVHVALAAWNSSAAGRAWRSSRRTTQKSSERAAADRSALIPSSIVQAAQLTRPKPQDPQNRAWALPRPVAQRWHPCVPNPARCDEHWRQVGLEGDGIDGEGLELQVSRRVCGERRKFIDTANGYQDETSEAFIGEWMETQGIRDQLIMIIATKYTFNFERGQPGFLNQASYVANNLKSMHISVEASLKKLRTSYIEILYAQF